MKKSLQGSLLVLLSLTVVLLPKGVNAQGPSSHKIPKKAKKDMFHFYTYIFYGLHEGRITSPTRSPNGKFVASIVHYGDTSSVDMEASGIHPFGIGRDDIYPYDLEDGWITGLTWRDNQTLVVTFLFHQSPASLPSRRWHNIDVLFQRDTSGIGPL